MIAKAGKHDNNNHNMAEFSKGIESNFCKEERLLQIISGDCQEVDIICI